MDEVNVVRQLKPFFACSIGKPSADPLATCVGGREGGVRSAFSIDVSPGPLPSTLASEKRMESLWRTTHLHPNPNPFHLPLSLRSSPLSKPLLPSSVKPSPHKPSSPKPRLLLRASHASSGSPAPKAPQSPISSILKPSLIALAAALLAASRFQKPSIAAVPPPAATVQPEMSSKESETLTEAEKERILEEYLDSCPEDTRSLRALMELKIKAIKLPEAIDIIDRIIVLEPGEKDLPLLKAHLQSYRGDTEAAKQGFEELLSCDPFLVEAYHGLVTAANHSDNTEELDAILKRVESAMELCKKERRKEDLRDFKLLVAQIKVVEGKYNDALKTYQELVRDEPRDFRPYLCQGIIYTLLRKKDEAEKHFQKYRRLVPRGHPYAQYFDDNMIAMKVFSQIEENKRKGALKV